MHNELRFDGRVAIVTGAGSGLGKAGAILLAQRGAKVVINCRPVNTTGAEDTLQKIKDFGGEAIIVPALMGIEEEAEKLVQKTIEAYGRIDIIYNNGGNGTQDNYIMEEPTQDLDDMLDCHIRGPLQLNRAAWPYMVKQNYGRILFTGSASCLGYWSSAKGPEGAYSICKAGAITMCRNTAMAGIPHNIIANIVLPLAYTNMVTKALGDENDFSQWLKRFLRADQAANSVLYLMHEDCPAVGEAISTAGGRVSRFFFSETLGYFNPDLTPEDVVDHWDDIMGRINPEGVMKSAFEVTQPREEAIIFSLLAKQDCPEALAELNKLSLVNTLPLKQQNLSTSAEE